MYTIWDRGIKKAGRVAFESDEAVLTARCNTGRLSLQIEAITDSVINVSRRKKNQERMNNSSLTSDRLVKTSGASCNAVSTPLYRLP